MLEFSQEEHDEMRAALDALALQVGARVPLERDEPGTVLVPLHPVLDTVALAPLLATTALTLLHPRACPRAHGAPSLMVPLGEALGVLAFRRHVPGALAQVMRRAACVPCAQEVRPAPSLP